MRLTFAGRKRRSTFRLPGTHLGGAIVWLLLGGAGLVVVAPDLAAARFLSPRVLAVTHLYTLGVIVASIFGAPPVLSDFVGASPPSIRVGVVGAWLLHAGVAPRPKRGFTDGYRSRRRVMASRRFHHLFMVIGLVCRRASAKNRRASEVTQASGRTRTERNVA